MSPPVFCVREQRLKLFRQLRGSPREPHHDQPPVIYPDRYPQTLLLSDLYTLLRQWTLYPARIRFEHREAETGAPSECRKPNLHQSVHCLIQDKSFNNLQVTTRP